MSRKLFVVALGLLSGLAVTLPVGAQYTPGSFMYFDHLANNTAINIGLLGKNTGSDDEEEESPPPPRVQSPKNVRLDFVASKAVRQKTVEEVIGAIGQLNPTQRDGLRAAFINNDIFAQTEAALRPYGLRTNNLADAMTMFLICAWDAAHGVSEESSRAKVTAVRRQMQAALSTNQTIGGLSDITKQQLSDTLFINALLIQAMADAAKDNPAIKANVQRSAMQGAATFGFDLSTITVGENGISVR